MDFRERIITKKVYIIGELCGQWGGDVPRAEQMILQCKMGGADAVKVQLWDTYRMPGENRERWEYLSMTQEQFVALKKYAKNLNIEFFASAFHEDRFNWMLEEDIEINKIASILPIMDFELCEKMVNTGMHTICSLGNWNKNEYPFANKNVVYLHCVSKYPHNLEEALEQLPKYFDDRLCGYSDHVIGIEACKEAVRRGAQIIEKHFTINKNLQSSTEAAHACSMTLDELIELRNFCDETTRD